MRRNVRRALSALLSVVMLLSLLVVPAGAAGETTHTVWVVGDSTACNYGPTDDTTHYYKRCGYGTKLADYMAAGYTVENLAVSGISSKSFLGHANYATLFGESGIKEGDILIIGFGHNDEKAEDPDRHTSPTGDWQTEGSFAKNLYDNYVVKAQEKGAKVILCTSIVRRAKDGVNFSDANLHITSEGSYPQAVIKLGQDKSIPVVNLTEITKTKYTALGGDENVKLHAWSIDQPSSVDNTHLNKYGAKWVAYWLAQAVTESTDPLFTADLKAAFSLTAGEPTAADLADAATPDWTLPPYTPPADDAASAQYTHPFVFENKKTGAQDQFKPTGFGDISLTGPVLEVTEDGQVHIQGNAKGKIANNHDGVYMYYYRIPKDTLFTFTATARVNSLGTGDSQTAFGLMARDDMYIDKKNDTTIASNYVAAGCLTQNANTTNCFYRSGGNLGNKGTLTTPAVKTGDTVKLSIVSNSDGYTCAIDGQTAQSAGFDISLANVDTENIYVGMFANRNADIYFRDIYLKVGDDVICDTRSETVPFSFQVMDDGWKFEDATGAESKTAVQGGKLTSITGVLNGDSAEALVFAAVYGLDGKMTGVKAITPKSGEIPVGLKMNGGETAKVFVLKKATLEPYGAAFEKTSGTPPKDPDAPEGRIKVWDFAGVEETDDKTYENMVTATAWKAAGVTAGSIAGGNHEVNGVIYNESSTGTLCSNVTGWPGTAGSYGVHEFADGYSSQGGIYAGGAGNQSANRRYLIVKGVKAGDKLTVYAGTSKADIAFSAGPISTGIAATAEYTSPLITAANGSYDKFAFVAKQDGDYKIWHDVGVLTSGGGKPIYCRVTLAKPAEVKGTVTAPAGVTGYGVKFINQTTKEETAATLSGNSFTAKLAPGYTYTASLTGATGYGFTNASKMVTVTDAESVSGKTGVALAVEEKHQYDYTGKITGFAGGYDLTNLVVTLVPDENAPAGTEEVTLTLGADQSYSVKLDPSVNYIVTLAGVNDYEVTAGGAVTSEGPAVAQDITVALKDQFAATGKFVTLSDGNIYGPLYADYEYADLAATVTDLTFKNVEDEYTYTATIENGGYSVDLRDGAYLASATVDGYKTSTHVVVDGGAVTRDLFFVSTAEPAAVAYAADIYVGDATKGALNYATITQAVDAIGRMTRTDGQRVTVHIAPGVYREQVQLDTPNVTFVGTDPTKETKLTWYYGIGYKYYSASENSSTKSIYDVEKAYDKYGKNIAGRWGATMWVTADGFRAENITLEASLNNYLTEEELADGVTCDTCKFARKYGAEVTSKDATERAAVIYVDGDTAATTEFKNCKLLSSQDTIITGGNMYFKNCLIEGMTDYICGPGNAIFDGCELRFKGYHKEYPNAATGGHITAPQTTTDEKGYLFRGCSVTASPNANMTVATGDFGRNWSATAGAMFVNTKLQRADLISATGWTDWSAAQPAKNANFKEYNTTLFSGDAVATTGRVEGTALSAEPTVGLTDYFGAWTPYYYVAEPDTVAFTTAPTLTDNGDINAPYPGHTLTVNYSLGENDVNDASIIQWYRVKAGADDVLVKSSVANVDKTYLIDKADEGCRIKATVTPRTAGGKTGAAASVTLADEAYVRTGYEDPTGSTDPVLGEGVNLFLAGDSTVKDYSAKGMTTGGKARDEGSWGEFLQAYVDDSVVTVVDYANGGRSARTFYNEGSLLKIQENIKAGDYLFIQFGHNDSGGSEKYPDRCVPLGEPNSEGVYPVTAPTTGTAPTMAADGTITAGTYTWDCGGTYKWYLQQYVDVALDAGAIPVLMTPVARMYYGADGKITSHHNWGGVKGAGNTYCDAVEQLWQENVAAGKNVLYLDAYTITETMFNDAYAASNNDTTGKQAMYTGDSTHCNKLGGMIEAALVAQSLQTLKDKDGANISIAHAVKAPASVLGETTTGDTVFMVNASGVLTANDLLTDYTTPATYWQTLGQELFQAIADKAAELNAPVKE